MNNNITKSLITLGMTLSAWSAQAAQNSQLAKVLDGSTVSCTQEEAFFTNRELPHVMVLSDVTESKDSMNFKLKVVPVSCQESRGTHKWAINTNPTVDSYSIPRSETRTDRITVELSDLSIMATNEIAKLAETNISASDLSQQQIIEIQVPKTADQFVDFNLKAKKTITNQSTGYKDSLESQWGSFRYIKGQNTLTKIPVLK